MIVREVVTIGGPAYAVLLILFFCVLGAIGDFHGKRGKR
jgi:hypothetical protein